MPYEQGTLIDGILGIAHALHHIAVLHLMCDVRDIDRSVGDREGRWSVQTGKGIVARDESLDSGESGSFDPTVFLYDVYPGGIGFSTKLFDLHERLLQETGDMILHCSCKEGCPSCVGPVNEVGALAKETALSILKGIR